MDIDSEKPLDLDRAEEHYQEQKFLAAELFDKDQAVENIISALDKNAKQKFSPEEEAQMCMWAFAREDEKATGFEISGEKLMKVVMQYLVKQKFDFSKAQAEILPFSKGPADSVVLLYALLHCLRTIPEFREERRRAQNRINILLSLLGLFIVAGGITLLAILANKGIFIKILFVIPLIGVALVDTPVRTILRTNKWLKKLQTE
jgi:hypothetical protein